MKLTSRIRALQDWSQEHLLPTFVVVGLALILIHSLIRILFIVAHITVGPGTLLAITISDSSILYFLVIFGTTTAVVCVQQKIDARFDRYERLITELLGQEEPK